MNEKKYKHLVDQFNKYYENYKDKSKAIILKYHHSFNVANYMYELADRLYLPEEDKYLAKAIGLLHDIGRFEQLLRFNSFNDENFDHADYSGIYLFDEGHIREFIKDDSNDSVIKEAVVNHNKYEIKEGLNERELLFAKMIRDMDKVDIYYQIGSKYQQEFFDKPSDDVVDEFFNGKSILNSMINNKSDRIINELTLVYDINFDESFEILRESDNLGFYISCIDVSKENEELFNKIVKKCYEVTGMGDGYVN